MGLYLAARRGGNATYRYDRAYRVNQYLLSNGPTDVLVNGQMKNRYDALPLLKTGGNPQILLSGITSHEHRGSIGTNIVGHQRGLEDGVDRSNCGNRVGRLEGVAGKPSYVASMRTDVNILGTQYVAIAGGYHIRVHSHFSGVDVVARTASSNTPSVIQVGDHPQDTTGIGFADRVRCNYTRLGV
jgi:hypothetical protein